MMTKIKSKLKEYEVIRHYRTVESQGVEASNKYEALKIAEANPENWSDDGWQESDREWTYKVTEIK